MLCVCAGRGNVYLSGPVGWGARCEAQAEESRAVYLGSIVLRKYVCIINLNWNDMLYQSLPSLQWYTF